MKLYNKQLKQVAQSNKDETIVVHRGRTPFGQHQESRPLAYLWPSPTPEVRDSRTDWFWSQSVVFTNPFKTGLSLDLTRGRGSWC